MGTYLIVTNQTAGGPELEEAIRTRIESGVGDFYVVVPMIEPDREAEGWMPSDPAFGIERADSSDIDASYRAAEEARKRAEFRLHQLLDKIQRAGGSADGQVGSSDPVEAVENALGRLTVDEVIVSTLPAGMSRWLKMDLPSRLSRRVEVPVTTVETEAR